MLTHVCVSFSFVLCFLFGFSFFANLGTLPYSESGTRSREIRSRIGKQSVGRTLRGLLLLRRSLPFKPPPILTLPQSPHPASSCPSSYLVPPSRGTFLSPSFSFLCTLGKPAFASPLTSPLSLSLSPMGEFSSPSSPPRFSTKPDGET